MKYMVNLHLQASHTYCSLRIHFHHSTVALENVGHFSWELVSWRYKPGAVAVQKLSQDEWGRTLDPVDTAVVMEKNLNQALLGLHTLVLPVQTSGSVTSWRITSQMRRWNSARSWASTWQIGCRWAGRCPFEGSTSTQEGLGACSPAASEGTPCMPLVSGLLPEHLPKATRQLFNDPGALSQAMDQMETVKVLQEKRKDLSL